MISILELLLYRIEVNIFTIRYNHLTKQIEKFMDKLLLALILLSSHSVFSAESPCTGGVKPAISSLTANPAAVNIGESSTILWNLSNDVSSCIKSGDWSGAITGPDVSNGIHASIIANITTDKTFNLQCSNANGITSLQSTTVSAIDPCSSSPPILGGNEDRTVLGNATANSDPYDGNYSKLQGELVTRPWPGIFGETYSLSLTKDQYLSAAFNSGSLTQSGGIQFTLTTSLQGLPPNTQTVVISECPGDFNTHLNQPECISNSNLRWSTDPTANDFGAFPKSCILEKNKAYYLNIVHSDNSEGDNFATSDCSSTYCGILFQQNNFQ